MLVEIYRLKPEESRHLAIRSIRDCVEGNLSDLEAVALVDKIIAHSDVDASLANTKNMKFNVHVKEDVGSTNWDTFRRLFDICPGHSTDVLRLWMVTVSTTVGTAHRDYTRLILASTFQLAHDYGKKDLDGVANSWVVEVQGPFEEGQVLFETEIK